MLFKIMQEEEGIYKNNEKKQRFTIKVLLLAIALFIYWVILIFVYENNFPKSNFNNVAHVRNKAGESEYFCENANSVRLKKTAEIITLKEIPEELKNTLIPTGEYMTKQCFWFNKKYMKQQIKDFIKSY